MSRDVEELFGEGEGAPTPRTAAILGLLGSGLVVAILGMACTAVPGGVMVLMAWMLAEKEVDRVDSGYLPADSRTVVNVMQTACYIGVLVVVALFAIQAYLFCSGFYDEFWNSLLTWWVGGDIPLSTPDPNNPLILPTVPAPAPTPAPAPVP